MSSFHYGRSAEARAHLAGRYRRSVRQLLPVSVILLASVSVLAACSRADAPHEPAPATSHASSELGSPGTSPSRPNPMPSNPAASSIPGGDDTQTGVVTNVVDGDTIDVAGVGRIRVIGIDTPERGACGHESSTVAMSVLVLGRQVTLASGAADDADRYDRLLRYVDQGSVDAGLSLIEDGWAIARYDSRDGYGGHPREDVYVAADAASPDRGCYPDDEP